MRRLRVPLVPGWLRWSAVLVVAVTIFYASVLVAPGDQPRDILGPQWDEQLHAIAYAGLALVTAYATADQRNRPCRRALAVILTAVAYGSLIELAQAAVPYRQFSYGDMVANAAGALLVVGWFLVEMRVRYRRVDFPVPLVNSLRRRQQ